MPCPKLSVLQEHAWSSSIDYIDCYAVVFEQSTLLDTTGKFYPWWTIYPTLPGNWSPDMTCSKCMFPMWSGLHS